jgi:hypothetical protein
MTAALKILDLLMFLNTTKYRRARAYRADNDYKIIDGRWCSSARQHSALKRFGNI